jgi:hypothetical protein
VQIPILIEPVAGNGCRARGAEPFSLSAEGATREEALAKLREQLEARVKAGEIVTLEVASAPHALASFVGMFKDDPAIDDWKRSMAEYRRTAGGDPNALSPCSRGEVK